MADEENPLGGGPFGVGPFGPLVGAVAAAAVAFSGASVTTSVPRTKTLHYQAKAFVAAPPEVLNPPAAATAESFSVTTGRASSKSLFYQARIGPPPVAAAVDNTGTFATWYVQLSRPIARAPTETGLYTPFVPSVAPQVTTAAWLQPFKRQVTGSFPVHTQPTFPYTLAAAVVVVDVTPDQWLPRWRGPPSYMVALAGGSPFVPKEAVLENTQTIDKWLQPFYQAVPHAWPTKQVLPFVPKEAVLENTVTPDKWLQAWQGPPRYTPAPKGGSPFIPKEAVLENTVTPDKWLVRFQGAAPVPPVHHTQPFLGYPYQAASNLTTTLEWMPAWRSPPSYTPIKVQALPFIPKADIVDRVTPDKWLQAWKGPPRTVPAQAGGLPFVPKEAVLENTVTPEKWLVRFAKAVPAPKPVPTQPVFGYPYVSQAIVVPYEQWWHQPLSRAAARPSVHAKPYQPFVPKEAVLENTQTLDKWQLSWNLAAKAPKPIHTQPFYGYPYEAAAVTAESFTIISAYPVHKTLFYQARIQPYPPPAAEPNTQTIDKWQQPLSRAPRATRQLLLLAQPFVPIVELYRNTVTPDKWLFRWQKAIDRRPVRHTQPFFGYPYYQTDTCVGAFDLAFQGDAFQVCRQELKGWLMPLSEPVKARPVNQPPASPFVYAPQPSNLTTTLEWLPGWQKAVPIRRPALSQPVFGYPYLGVENTTTIDKWIFRWQGPPRYWPLGKPYQPFVPKEAVLENTQTPNKWLQRWQGPPRYWPPRIAAQPFVPREAVRENTQTPDKWLFRFQKPVPHGWPTHTQPFFGYPYRDIYSIGGPADEPERVICLLAASRVAVVPETLRNATVPLALRVVTVPELSRVAEPLPSDTLVSSNEYRDEVCAPFNNAAGIPIVGSEAPVTITTTIEWLRPWQGPPHYNPAPQSGVLFVQREVASLEFALVDHGTATSGTIGTQDFGATNADRILLLAVAANASNGTAQTLTAVSIGGVVATHMHGDQLPGAGAAVQRLDVWYAAVPTGTTGTISVTTGHNRLNWALYRAVNVVSLTPHDTFSDTNPINPQSIDVPAGGAVIAIGNSTGTTPFVLDNITNDHNGTAGTLNYAAIGSDEYSIATTVSNIDENPNGSGVDAMIGVSFR